MSRTYKDQKQYMAKSFVKKATKPFKQKFIKFKLCGPPVYLPIADEPVGENDVETYAENMDGDLCPMCGAPTQFENWLLACSQCDWLDEGDESIESLNIEDQNASAA